MIESILPNGVVSAELFADPPGLTPHPLEAPLVAKAVDKRKREFTSARHCARVAMEKLGVEPAPIMRGKSGAPQWPKGVVGSLTHCDGYRGAVLAYSMQVRSVGIDAEPHGPLPDGVLGAVSLEAEREWLATVGRDDVHWDRVLFCAKEATYKAWFPLTHRWLGFEDAHITFAIDSSDSSGQAGTFTSQILIDPEAEFGPPLTSLAGRWSVRNGIALTAIVL